MGISCVAVFAPETNQLLSDQVNRYGIPVCKVPYGRVADKDRPGADLMPYHITLCGCKNRYEQEVTSAVFRLQWKPCSVQVTDVKISGDLLYWEIVASRDFQNQHCLYYESFPEEAREGQYRPGWIFFHITISIDNDYGRLHCLHEAMRQDFEPFLLDVESVRLYHVWPPCEIG